MKKPYYLTLWILLSCSLFCLGQKKNRALNPRVQNFNSVIALSKQLSSVSCIHYKPGADDFETQFRLFKGTALLLPQQSQRVLTPTLALLSDDRISEMRVTLTGRRPALSNMQTCRLQAANFQGAFVDLQTITGSEIRMFRAYEWRDYSADDLLERKKLCEERMRILLTKGVNNAIALKSFDNFERNFQLINEQAEHGGHVYGLHPKDIENLQKETVNTFGASFEKAHEDNSQEQDRALREIARKMREIDKKYPIIRDTLYCRDYIAHQSFAPGNNIKELRCRIIEGNISSETILLNVTASPKVLMCFAQGGFCNLPIGCDNGTTEDPSVKADENVCESLGRSAALFPTTTTERGCNDMCCSSCTNILELLARTLINHGLANKVRGIKNDGNEMCTVASSENNIENEIVLGWWRNTKEESACHTDIVFNDIIADFYRAGNRHVILLGQSHGGQKLTEMINGDGWINDITIDLFVLWDGTGPNCRIQSDGSVVCAVQSVGDKPKYVLNFFQKNGLSWQEFWQGDHVIQANEEYDFSGCLSHNAIARSIFVHETTDAAIYRTVVNIRNAARPGDD